MQNSITIQNGSGASVRASINNALQSIVTDFAGSTDPSSMTPSNAFPYCTWLDTTNGLLKRRNAANTSWNSIGTVNSSGKIMLFGVYGHSGVKTVTANTTLTSDDINNFIVVNSANAVTLTMPTPTAYMSFKIFNKGSGTVTLTNGTFYGESGSASNMQLSSNQSVNLSSDGTNFYAI
jgi:hypothetical protein